MTHRPRSCRVLFALGLSCIAFGLLGAHAVAHARPAGQQQRPSIVVSGTPAGTRMIESSAYASLPFAQGSSPASPQKVVIDDGAQGDFFGWAVAIDGHTALVGAYGVTVGVHEQQGLAYIFTETNGIWTQAATLTADDGRAFDTFGSAVGLADGIAAIGAYQADGGIGYVYVFTGSGSHWTQAAKLSTGTTADECLGWSVAVTRSNVLAGAPFAKIEGNQFGAVYSFAPGTGGWTQTQKLTASDAGLGAFFGNAIAIDGANAVIGADSAQIGDNYTQGAAYVFRNSGGSWAEQAKLVAVDGVAFDNFGRSVAISGSTILVGAPYVTVHDNAFEGAVYVFDGAGTDWQQSQKLVASDGVANGYFGWSVAVSGDNAIVGATAFDDQDTGEAYAFARSAGVWTQRQSLVSGDGPDPDFFGWSVGLSGTNALIGEPLAKVGANYDQGASFFYAAPADTIFADGFD